MEEVKEKLTSEEVKVDAPEKEVEEENVEDYFNPFAEVKEEVVKEEVKEEVVDDKDKPQVPVVDTSNELKEVKATLEAQKTVAKFVKENPMYADYAEEISDMTAKAMVRNVPNPIEFAIRNIKSPSEWVEIGTKLGIDAAGTALRSKIGGSSFARGEEVQKDFGAMSTNDFEAFVNSVKNQ